MELVNRRIIVFILKCFMNNDDGKDGETAKILKGN